MTLEHQDSELRLLMAELSSYLLAQNRPFNNTNLVDSMAAKLKVGKTAVTKALDTLEAESLVQVRCPFSLLAFFAKLSVA